MSKLDKLILELCPDGVERKKVGDLCNISRGVVISKQYIEENKGDYPVYSSQTENDGELGKINTFRYSGEYLTWTTDGANAGSVFYRNGKFNITNVCGLLEKKNSELNLKFLYYVLTMEASRHVNRGMGNPKLMSNVMSNINVPIPPSSVQDEIVRILDKFSESTTELITELTAELAARKKQYEFYRDELLSVKKNIPLVKLGDIVEMKHNQRYLAYVIATAEARLQKSKEKIESKEIQIPLPSLEVQERYADVLDSFDNICIRLNIELPTEIEERRKQYEYYRDLLLTFAETGNMLMADKQTELSAIRIIQHVFGYAPVRLGLIAKISRGGNFQKKDFIINGKPCIHYGQLYTHFGIHADKTLTFVNDDIFKKSKIAKNGDIIMAVTSENVKDVCSCTAWLGNEDVAISGHTAIINHNQNAKFMSYYFHSSDFFAQKKKLAHGTKVIEVTPDKLNDIIIMLPPIEEQERIVMLLDRFDIFCNDLSAGILAEIEARKKQYEYYRNKLLSF